MARRLGRDSGLFVRTQGGALAALVCAASVCPTPATAAPMHVARMDGLRGDPVDTGPFAFWWNPAALARPGRALGLHGLFAMRAASYDRDAALNDVAPDEAAANAGLATIDTAGVIPALGFRQGFADVGPFDLGFGLGFFVPFAGVADWARHPDAPAEHPGAYDGPQRWATIHSRLVFLAGSVGFGAAHRASGVSLGIAPTLYYGELATTRARNVDRSDDLVDVTGELKEGRIVFEADDIRVGFNVGLRWDASPDLGFALTWHQVPEFVMDGRAKVAYGTADPFSIGAELAFPLPDLFRAGASIGLPGGWVLRPFLEFARWSVMERQVAVSKGEGQPLIEIERDFDDVWGFRLRCDTPRWRGWGATFGGGFETAATPTSTHEPGLAEGESVEAMLGLDYTFEAGVRVSLSTTLQTFFARDVSDSIQKPTTNGRYTDDRVFSTLDVEVPF
ncbi:outer membrane protein transport protein [Myxococcota bacterium]|nr:outer membrane protein transport protein [Myxococcota bacterium]